MHRIISQGHLCALGEMQDDYLPDHTRHLNDPDVNRFIASRPPFTIDQQREWFRRHREKGGYAFAVLAPELKNDIRLVFVGVMDFRDVDHDERTAHSASVIGDKHYWRRGIAREARLLQLKIGFGELGFEWIYSETIRPNIRSQRLLESTGYELFDIHVNARTIEDIPQDEMFYRISRAMWLPHWESYMSRR